MCPTATPVAWYSARLLHKRWYRNVEKELSPCISSTGIFHLFDKYHCLFLRVIKSGLVGFNSYVWSPSVSNLQMGFSYIENGGTRVIMSLALAIMGHRPSPPATWARVVEVPRVSYILVENHWRNVKCCFLLIGSWVSQLLTRSGLLRVVQCSWFLKILYMEQIHLQIWNEGIDVD